MHKLISYSVCLLILVVLNYSCNTKTVVAKSHQETRDTSVRFAKRFAICNTDSFKVIYLFASRNILDTTHRILLYKGKKPSCSAATICVKVPCDRIASMSSIYSSMITQLGGAEKIIAVERIDYYNNAEVLNRFKEGLIEELQRSSDLNRERTIQLKPDVLFTFGMGNVEKDKEDKISAAGIPVVVSLDHLEETPLGRAEWIKFFACFLGREEEAERYFYKVQSEYMALSKQAGENINRPSVFTELKYGDTWYVPGGKSYMAVLINDAGADYVWKDDSSSGSLPLSFETVYRKAANADYWLNVSMCKHYKEMTEQDKRYADFKAFRLKQVFNNNKRMNAGGYSEYWETGIASPHLVLNDLIKIFNSNSNRDSLTTNLYYYTPLKE
jgi:iron complex transport system substrate-binding protein